MPIYEAAGYRTRGKCKLTKQEKKDAEAALFGLRPIPPMTNLNPVPISPEDIERMRTIVAQSDDANKRENREFDLNDPPRKQYVHQTYPMTLYNHERRENREAKNPKELAEALAHGWQKEPYPMEVSNEIELDPETEKEIEALKAKARANAKADKAKAKK